MLSVSVTPLQSTFECLNQSLWNLVYIYIYGTKAHLNGVFHKSLPSVCVCIPPIVARQRPDKRVPAATNTGNNSRIVGRVFFYAVDVLIEEESVGRCIPLSLLGNNSVNILPRQRRIIGGVVFCATYVVSKESSSLDLPRTSCFCYSEVKELCNNIKNAV
jgi:hypothetical protein